MDHHRATGRGRRAFPLVLGCLWVGMPWGLAAAPSTPAIDGGQTLAHQHARALAAMAADRAVAGATVPGLGRLWYATSHHRTDGCGTVTATVLDARGQPGRRVWDAQERLARRNPASRVIYTQTTNGLAVELRPELLDPAQQAALAVNPPGAVPVDAGVADRVAWLRGEDVPGLRPWAPAAAPAARRLADMVGVPLRFVPGDHQAPGGGPVPGGVRPVQRQRPGVVYGGGHGGMLHAFHAGTSAGAASPRGGDELFAYMPSELMRPDDTHRLCVAGAVDVADVDEGGRRRTVLAGAMGAGGRTVFALDVSDPEHFQAASVLWEFRYSDAVCRADPAGLRGSTACRDMGYGITRPKVVRLPGGRWAVVFGNGLHSAGHRAKLFVVDLRSGRLLYLVDTGVGDAQAPNGLGPVAVTDWPVGDQALRRLYAGDERGNLWRFLIPADGEAPGAQRLLSATDAQGRPQPISAEPALAARPGAGRGIVVALGTGGLRDVLGDATAARQVQTLYGVFDHHDVPAVDVSRSQLREQVISANSASQTIDGVVWPAGSLRQLTNHGLEAPDKGWRLDLPGPGERVLDKPVFPSGSWHETVLFATRIPGRGPDGGTAQGFLMAVDLLNGGRGARSALRLGALQALGLRSVGGTSASGVRGAWAPRPVSFRITGSIDAAAGVDLGYDAGGTTPIEIRNTAGPGGRLSWRQLR